MKFISTRDNAPPASLATALSSGLASDGGLFMPSSIPRLENPPDPGAGLAECAFQMLEPFAESAMAASDLQSLLVEALDFPIPLRQLNDNTWLLELFHGPTLAFKDVGARCLARLLVAIDKETASPLTVLVATSGDTGGAVAAAFRNLPGIQVAVLYPRGRVTWQQERQFASLGGNIRALCVDGSFDDCQRLTREAFLDRELSDRLRLTSANSISLGRLLPQTAYYAFAASQFEEPPIFVTPSGNFGNLTAGLIAREMGVPIKHFVAATNANDVVPRYLRSGNYDPLPAIVTLSSAMDVGSPSNWERIEWLAGGDLETMRRRIWPSRHTDAEVRDCIRRTWKETGVLVDPHTAVGCLAREACALAGERGPAVVLATAHPAKFSETIEQATGRSLELPQVLRARLSAPLKREDLAPSLGALRQCLLQEWPD